MAIRDLFELVDFEENEVKISPIKQHFKKIKFKDISRKNISLNWQKYRLKRLREKMATMEFSENELKTDNIPRTSKKVLTKAEKIADLEARITFIETGKKTKLEFINSRALNLKKLMMENLMSNGEYIYSVPSSIADKIRRGDYEQKEETMEDVYSSSENSDDIDSELTREIEAAIAAKEADMKKANEAAYQTQGVEYIPSPISREEIEKEIKGKLATDDSTISRTDVEDAIKTGLDTIEVSEEVTKESIRAAIKNEMEKIEMEDRPVSVVNEDGSYRLRREDIDDEIRINYFDRSQLDEPVRDLELVPPTEVTPLSDIKVSKPTDVPTPKIKGEYGNESSKTTDLAEREVPIVVPTRAATETSEVKESVGAEYNAQGSSNSDIETLLAKIEILKKEKQKLEAARQEETEQLVDTDVTLAKTKADLASFAESLEAECNGEKAAVESLQAQRAAKQSEINAALAIMGITDSAQTVETTKGRAK